MMSNIVVDIIRHCYDIYTKNNDRAAMFVQVFSVTLVTFAFMPWRTWLDVAEWPFRRGVVLHDMFVSVSIDTVSTYCLLCCTAPCWFYG